MSFLFVKRGVGGGRFRGELRFHAEIEGPTPGLKSGLEIFSLKKP